MMSDHWKSLANQFGIPGPADPPKTQKPAERVNAPAVAPQSSTDTPAASRAPVAPPSQPPSLPPRSVPQPAVIPPASGAVPASGAAPVSEASPAAASGSSRSLESRPARHRSSMWGDDADAVSDIPSPEPVKPVAATPSVSEPTTRLVPPRPVDPLSAIVSIDRGPTVPGFDLPEDQSPGAPKVPVRRSAWDALIGTLGIKTSAEAAAEKAAKVAPPVQHPAPVAREPESRESSSRERVGRDAPGRDLPGKESVGRDSRERRPSGRHAESGRRSEAIEHRGPQATAPSRDESREHEPVSSGFGAGLIDNDDSASRTRASGVVRSEGDLDADDDRPRGRGRRGGSRRRGRGAGGEREASATPQAGSDWELDPLDDDDDQSATSELVQPLESPRDRARPAAEPLDDSTDSADRPRRSRRRGQRQMLSIEDVEQGQPSGSGEPAGRPAAGRGEPPASDRPRRRDESSPRERQPRAERVEGERSDSSRSESARPERAPRSGRDRHEESSLPSAARAGQRRPEPRRAESTRAESTRAESSRADDDFVEFDDDDTGSGFGSGLGPEAKSPVSGEEDEPRTRPRRRRGRRGRGGAPREDRPGVESAGEGDDEPEAVMDLPSFDDDLEDDDEAERLRRRSRSGRSRTGRRDPVAGDVGVGKPHDPDAAPRGADFPIDAKARNVPTWLDTVGLLVDSNIQRRNTNGGGGQRGAGPQGRGGRR